MVVSTVSPLSNHSTSRPPSTATTSMLPSRNSSEHFFMLGDDRKLSICEDYQRTQKCLLNPFACEEQSAEELIYNLFKIPHKNDASIGKLLMVLKNYGLQESDPRLQPMMAKIHEFEQQKEDTRGEARDPRHWKLKREYFKLCISESLSLISQTLQNDLIVPSWGEFTRIIKEIYLKCKNEECGGKVADYIPQLSRMSPDYWGVALCTVDGQRYALGDSKIPFCVQSVSKAFNYAIAASELGAEYVHRHVGQEPSGRLFNEICLDSNQKPHNPMVNSGAIIVTSLIQKNLNMADRFDHMLTQYRKISGGEYVGFNNAVFLSERSTADRNFALAYYMKENGCFPPETNSLTEALDFYFQLCSLEVTCESAAVMAATLANGGVCPITGERCIGSSQCRDVLSLMNSCGMYDYSGQFAFHVGLPAKSGVSGIMIVVVPNLLGLALWSPPLDKLGNSARGVSFCKELVQRFNFHNYDSLAHNESHKFDPRRRVGEREKDQIVSLLFAAKAGDLNTVRRMYMQGYDLEMADYDKRTALHLAASEGNTEVAQFLLYIARVRPDPRDRWNRTPLHDAKAQGHLGCIQLLEKVLSIVEHREDVDEEDPFSREGTDSSYYAPPTEKPKFHIGEPPQQSSQRPENINAKNMGSLVRKVATEDALYRQRANSLDGNAAISPSGSASFTKLTQNGKTEASAGAREGSNSRAEFGTFEKSGGKSGGGAMSPSLSRRNGPVYRRQDSNVTQRAESVERNAHDSTYERDHSRQRHNLSPKLSSASNTSNASNRCRKFSPDYHVNTRSNKKKYSNGSGYSEPSYSHNHGHYGENNTSDYGRHRNEGHSSDAISDIEGKCTVSLKEYRSHHGHENGYGIPKRKTSKAKRDRKYSMRRAPDSDREDESGYHNETGRNEDYSSGGEQPMARIDHKSTVVNVASNQKSPKLVDIATQATPEDYKETGQDHEKSRKKNNEKSQQKNHEEGQKQNYEVSQEDSDESERRRFINGNNNERRYSDLSLNHINHINQRIVGHNPSTWSVDCRSDVIARLKETPLKMALGKVPPSLPKETRSYTSLLSYGGSSASLSVQAARATTAVQSEILETIKRNMQLNVGNVSSSSESSTESDSEPELQNGATNDEITKTADHYSINNKMNSQAPIYTEC